MNTKPSSCQRSSNFLSLCVCQFALTLISINRMVFASPKSIQATVTLLENLHIILEKTPQSDIRSEVLPLLFNSFESNTMQIQSAALVAVANVYEYVDELSIRRMVLPKIKTVFEKNQSDLKIMSNVLQCVERILDKLDKSQIIDEVLPMLYEIRLSDPEIILRVVRKYIFLFQVKLSVSAWKRQKRFSRKVNNFRLKSSEQFSAQQQYFPSPVHGRRRCCGIRKVNFISKFSSNFNILFFNTKKEFLSFANAVRDFSSNFSFAGSEILALSRSERYYARLPASSRSSPCL